MRRAQSNEQGLIDDGAQAPLRCNWALLLVPLGATLLACAAAVSSQLTAVWQLDRAAVAQGQWWRLFTGHLTHWGFDHLFWDAAVFAVLGLACMRRAAVRTVACLIAASAAISATVLAVHSDLAAYRGLSGLDTALFALLAAELAREARLHGDRRLQAVVVAALLGLGLKLAYEIATGATLFVDSRAAGFTPLPSVHAVGAAAGLLFGSFKLRRPRGAASRTLGYLGWGVGRLVGGRHRRV